MADPTPPTGPSPASPLSVRELIRAAQTESRRLTARARTADGVPLTAGWPFVVTAAHALLEAIPGPGSRGEDPQLLVRQVSLMRSRAQRFGPAGSPHPAMRDVAATWDEATRLLREHATVSDLPSPAWLADADAARYRVVSTLATLAHVTRRELRDYAQVMAEAENHNPGQALPRDMGSVALTAWLRTLASQEQTALAYVDNHRGALQGEQHGPPPVTASPLRVQLGVQLATWSSIALSRASDPLVNATDLHGIAKTQAALLHLSTALIAAASEQGRLDAPTAQYLVRRVTAARTAWDVTADQWGLLQTPDVSAQPHPGAVHAGRALTTSMHSLVFGTAGWRPPAEIATQLGAGSAPQLLRSITESSAELADIYAALPDELHAAARIRAPTIALLTITRGSDQLAAATADYSRYAGTVKRFDTPMSLARTGSARKLHRPPPETLHQLRRNGTAFIELTRRADDAVITATIPPPRENAPWARIRAQLNPPPFKTHPQRHRPDPRSGPTP